MSFQIRDIILYNARGEARVVPLKTGAVNVITGASKTGKSALASIIDYCLGSGSCGVPEGAISQTVKWYGLRLALQDGEAFVARRAPVAGRSSSSDVYYNVGKTVEIPDGASLEATTNVDALVPLLSRAAGIADNLHEPPEGQTRQALSATIRHALYFAFQQQDEIISRKHLFHKQSEQFIPQAIKDVLPYFLGAVDDDHVARQNELRRLRDKLRAHERRLAELEAIRGDGLSKAHSLLAEAQDAGVADPGAVPGSLKETFDLLRNALSKPAEAELLSIVGGDWVQIPVCMITPPSSPHRAAASAQA